MANPMGMMEMVKGQAYFAMTQMGMMQFSETFFSGFVLGEHAPIKGLDQRVGVGAGQERGGWSRLGQGLLRRDSHGDDAVLRDLLLGLRAR